MNASSSIFSIGTLRERTAASSPSARTHLAPDCTATSRISADTGTPVQSLVLVSPCRLCAVALAGPDHQPEPLLPEHSRNMSRPIDGKRFRSSSV